MEKRSIISPLPTPATNDKDSPKKFEFFSVGSKVEASSEDEGFKGAWYVGKIIKTNKRKGKCVIEYESLTCDEEPLKPLKEKVDISFLRPVPPPAAADQIYEVHDVVEAFHRDGWWKGVVRKVEIFEGEEKSSAKYTVFFNPPPEELAFCCKDLRFHLVWADGKWSQPSKEEIPIIMLRNVSKHNQRKKSCAKRKRDELSRSKDEYCVRMTRSNCLDFVEEEEDNGFWQKDKGAVMSPKDFRNADVMAKTPTIVPVEDYIEIPGESCNSVVDDQVPPENFENEGHVANTNQSAAIIVRSDEELVENLNQSPDVIVQPNHEPVEERAMPFSKKLSLWEHVDSLDVFRFMPQNPHFSPLFKLNDLLREGHAIGLFLNFSRLVEMTSKMRADDPREVFERNLEALVDLESYGFEVKPVVDRLKKLLSIKTRQEELQNESKDIQVKISKCDADNKQVVEQLRQVYEKISKLKTQRAMKVSEKLIKKSESDSLRLAANVIEEQIAKADLDFENLAAAQQIAKADLDFENLAAAP